MRKTFKTLALVASALFLISATAFTQQVQVAKTIPNSSSPDGLIGFLEFRPSDYGSQKHPLIIFLHGAAEGGNGTSDIGKVAWNSLPNLLSTGKASMRFTYNGQTSSFVVISPQLSKSFFYWPSFYVRDIISYAKANLQIDPNRIYVTGLSLGGGGVWRLISDAQTLDPSFDAGLAAAAPICATGEESDADYCRTVGANHLPVWAFHSMDDVNVPVSVTQHVEAVSKACGVTPAGKFTYYQVGGHGGAWINAYDTGHITRTVSDGSSFTANPNLFEWFLSNTRSGTGTNTPPSISVSGPQTIVLPTNTVNVSGTGTGTSGATISSYRWAQTSGPSTATIVAPGSSSTAINGLQQGVYIFTLTVTDNRGLTNSAAVTITVNPAVGANQPPVSNAGTAQTITLPVNSVTLDGSASTDPDGRIVEYYWGQSSGPSTSSVANNFSMSTTANNLVQGVYTFVLQVKDNAGAMAYSIKTVTVNAAVATNQPPVANAGSAQTITLPTNTGTLNGTASADPDGSIVSYFWSQSSGPSSSTITNNAAASTTVTNLVQGVYTFLLQVKDNAGALAYATKTITVNAAAGNQPPVSNAGNAQTIVLPTSSVSLDGSASYDTDGTIVEYYWAQSSGPSSSVIANNFSLTTTASNLVQGVYVFVLQAKDNQGALSYSLKTVTVNAAAVNQPPVSNAGSAQTIVLPANSVTLNAAASYDPDGSIIEYYWGQSSGPSSSSIANNFAASTTASNLVQGVYVFVLQVKDNNGALAYSIKTVTVNASGARVVATTDTAALRQAPSITGTVNDGKLLTMYPNPVQSSTSIVLNSETSGGKLVNIYTSTGLLAASYRWQTVKGRNVFLVKNISGLASGQYSIVVTDSNGKIIGAIKFIKS